MKLEPSEQTRIYSVSELTREIKLHLEGEFFDIWVVGEISNFKQHSSGHLYFTLRDSRTQLSAVMFRSARRFLKFRPADGMAVLARGHITLYEPRGAYQLQVDRIEPRGKGALQLAFEQLKEKLAKEGLFAPERKRALPLLPQRIGVVTSPSGAAIRDICRILHRRFPNLEVLLYPAQVQGDLAAAEITKGIQVLNRLGGFDVLIVGRGGGSLEDLWPFNEESVARAISTSAIPVISAVGHEVDFTIADFTADVRAATPSAAAEIVVSRKEDFLGHVARLEKRADQSLVHRMSQLRSGVERLAAHQAFLAVRHAAQTGSQRLDELTFRTRALIDRIAQASRGRLDVLTRQLEAFRIDRQLGQSRTKLAHLSSLLRSAERARRSRAGERLARAGARLEALSPLAVLGRGYSLTWHGDGKLLRDAGSVTPGDPVRVTLERGELDCRVERSRPTRERLFP
jgi:exodeoxyribonuclease VII large subunit